MGEFFEEVREALAGRYRIERELGQGGTATVYLAHDMKHDREVAIKVLRREVAAVVGTTRFLREIDIAAKLTHPDILSLHDSGEIGGLLYFVMPYLADGSLRQRLRHGTPVSVDETIRVLHDIAEALDYAHGCGVVHRDIKPANVLLSGRHHLVADFGIAKALLDATDVTNPKTAAPVGTPAYMAPEQVMADPLIVSLARHLDIDVIAEGVDSESQLALLRDMSCPQAQGYYFSRPVDADRAALLLEEGGMGGADAERVDPAA